MTQLPVSAITIGERRREDSGDLDALAASIAQFGLLHPIVVDESSTLVAGGRRLDAVKLLGWESVPVTLLGDLTEAERREIELEENLRRKDLTAYERNKILVGLAATASEILRQQEFSAESTENSHGGRPRKVDAKERVAERIGVPEPTIRQAERHVSTVEANPFMGGADWKQYHVLEARSHLERLPELERPKAARLIAQPGTPPRDACNVLANLAAMPAPNRQRVFELNESDDVRDRSLALTTAAEKAAMPDPRLTRLRAAIDELRGAVQPFPNDPLTPRIAALIEEARSIVTAIKEASRDN